MFSRCTKIAKPNLCSKTDNNKTAWINACYSIHILSIAGRNLIFCLNFKATQQKKCFSTYPWRSTWHVSIFIANFFFLFVWFQFFSWHLKIPKTPKAQILMYNPWIFESYTFLSLKRKGALTILSNICNKSFVNIVNGV